MRTFHSLLIVGALTMPASLAAQKLAAGTWTGSIAPPNGGTLEATFNVRVSGDSTKITLNADGRTIEAYDVKVEAKRVLFAFAAGSNAIQCTLVLGDDKSYSGDCLDSRGGKGAIAMRPPKP